MEVNQRAEPERVENNVPKVLFLTNLAPPYRIPVWEELGRAVDLTVGLLERDVRWNKDLPRERAQDWHLDAAPPSRWLAQGLPAWRFGRRDRIFYLLPPLTARRCAGFDVVILGGWESPAYWQVARIARAAGARTLGFYESTLDSSRYSRGPVAAARRRFFRQLDGVVVPGISAERAVEARGARRVWRGFNAVDVSRFAEARPEASEHDGGHRFLFVGRLTAVKNVESVLRAFADMPPDCTLGIAGSGGEQGRLRQLALELGVTDRLRWHGYVEYGRMPALMAGHDSLVLASKSEPWGLVVNEALASGMHVVVSENCGVAASVSDMPGVYLCSVDSDSIRRGMQESLANWRGRIVAPPILAHTPETFARVFRSAIKDVLECS